MKIKITLVAILLGLGLGIGVALNTGDQLNRHFTSSTVAHIDIEEPRVGISTSLPLKLELNLNENSTYDVVAMLPESQIGFASTGQYRMTQHEILFSADTHTPLDLEGDKGGVIEQLFVRPGSFDGMMTLIDIGERGSILVGNKVVLYLQP